MAHGVYCCCLDVGNESRSVSIPYDVSSTIGYHSNSWASCLVVYRLSWQNTVIFTAHVKLFARRIGSHNGDVLKMKIAVLVSLSQSWSCRSTADLSRYNNPFYFRTSLSQVNSRDEILETYWLKPCLHSPATVAKTATVAKFSDKLSPNLSPNSATIVASVDRA